jgi:Calcium-activated chloride channel
VWSAVYYQSWSQYRAELAYKWRVYQCEEQDEVMLPEFQQRQKKKLRVNPITHMEEPVVPTLEKVVRYLGCWRTALLIVSLGWEGSGWVEGFQDSKILSVFHVKPPPPSFSLYSSGSSSSACWPTA